MNSSVRGMLSQNLARLVAVAVLAVLQAVFVITLTTRAGRHVYLRRRAARRGAGAAEQPGVYLVRRCEGPHRALRWGALLLLLLSLAMLSESLRLLWYSLQNIREGLSNSLMWLIIFTDLPQLLLLWMAGVPAVGAAMHALFWRQGEGYRLRTSRLFALFALAGAALLVVMMGLDP